MRGTDLVHPVLREKIYALKDLCQERGLLIGIGETLRTEAEQDALYAKGRSATGSIVTNAKGSTYSSMHQWGIAFDFYRNDGRGAYNAADNFFERVGEIGKSMGLEWGGDWTGIKDMPHFQLPDWGSAPTVLKKMYKTPKKFMDTWEEAMTDNERKAFEELKSRVNELAQRAERVYHYTAELPDWAQPTMQKLMDMGIYVGNAEDDLNLPEGIMRVLVINDRAGLYE